MRPDTFRDAVVVGHDLRFQRVSGNAFQNGILTARTELVEAVVALTDHRFPDEKLRGNQIAEIIRAGVIGTPACGKIAGVAVLHDSSDEELDGVRGNGVVVIVRVVIPEILVLLGEGIAGLLGHAGFDAVARLSVVAADGAGDRPLALFRRPAVEIAVRGVSPAGIAADVAGTGEGHDVDLLLRSRRECRGAADAQHGGEQKGKRQHSGNGAFENTCFHLRFSPCFFEFLK